MSNFLNDTWEVCGTDVESFKEELNNIEKRTRTNMILMDQVNFLSISDMGTGYIAVPLHSDSIWKKGKTSLYLRKYETNKDGLIKRGYEESVASEAFANGLLMTESNKRLTQKKIKELIDNGMYTPISQKAMGTISNRINKRGNGAFLPDGLIRDLAIVQKFNKPIPVTLVSRIDPDTKLEKIFAIMSEKYTRISQKIILDIISKIEEEAEEDIGKAVCIGWNINHSITRIYVEFPDAGKEFKETYEYPDEIIPGVIIETSDIGDCSLRVRGYYREQASNVIFYMEDECFKAHAGEIKTNEIMDLVKINIFAKLSYYPKHLAELMTIDITNETMTATMKKKTLTKLYRKISKEIGLVKAITKLREKALIDQLIDMINPEIDYTAYDVAMTFLTLASYIETKDRSVVDAIAKTAPNIMKFKFVEEEPELLII